jgi:hypothetical protein
MTTLHYFGQLQNKSKSIEPDLKSLCLLDLYVTLLCKFSNFIFFLGKFNGRLFHKPEGPKGHLVEMLQNIFRLP